MRIANVIGQVTLSRAHESVVGGRFVVAMPLDGAALRGHAGDRQDVVVVYDDLGAASDMRIAVSEGTEATMPFRPKRVPIDAYNAAILDRVSVVDENGAGHGQ